MKKATEFLFFFCDVLCFGVLRGGLFWNASNRKFRHFCFFVCCLVTEVGVF
jgi:hypothetical protein